ncbi:hypothetical protein [Candidatus Carsonella ruddii]|uniref:hypothetical protein n=1 Tax=Carsonella ruddii TaxID=114186 RepID=UPI0012FD5B5D|nr:hypothetical protein [Candidatus Carsonella ruddii]
MNKKNYLLIIKNFFLKIKIFFLNINTKKNKFKIIFNKFFFINYNKKIYFK